MSQNRSTAVMQRRAVAPDSLDYFPTPPFATRALCEWLEERLGRSLSTMSAWEPACGEGHMVRPLREYFRTVRASDVHPYVTIDGQAFELVDFANQLMPPMGAADFIITNPPFMLAEQFIAASMARSRVGFALFVRSAFLEGQERYDTLWTVNPPTHILQFTERVVLLKDRLIQSGKVDPFAEKPGTKASTATSYVWLVWLHHSEPDTFFEWLAPCRERLERPGDYPDYGAGQCAPPGALFDEESLTFAGDA